MYPSTLVTMKFCQNCNLPGQCLLPSVVDSHEGTEEGVREEWYRAKILYLETASVIDVGVLDEKGLSWTMPG